MKTIGVIPARYASSRLPGKPLVDICGKPMLWWVYQRGLHVKGLDDLYIAADDERICNICEQYGLRFLITSDKHDKHVDRIHEVSEKIKSDYYVVICGDEPLIDPLNVELVFPSVETDNEICIVRSLMREMHDPVEALDPSNIKVLVDTNNRCLMLTRSIVPFPYKTLDFKIKKLVGIECYNKSALDFFVTHPAGELERIEDITLLRFIENNIPVQLIMTDKHQLGVDTQSDLDKVRKIIENSGGI